MADVLSGVVSANSLWGLGDLGGRLVKDTGGNKEVQ